MSTVRVLICYHLEHSVGLKREEITGGWTEINCEELHGSHSLSHVVRVTE